jgi:hypothetical protein
MNAVDTPPQSATGFWSIERFVAFIVGPVVAAGAGWLSTFLATEAGISVNSESIVAIFGAGALSAGGLVWKWLHGRQVEMQVQGTLAAVNQVPGASDFIHTTLHDLEGLAQSAAGKAVAAINGGSPTEQPPPIPPALGDPAPASQGADQGAASGQ